MSKKISNNNCLSEKISSLINAKPALIESDNEDITTIEKIKTIHNDSDISADELEITNYRKINCALLDEEDSKYSGKGISRKDLTDDESGLSQTDEEDILSDEDSEVESEESQYDSDSRSKDFVKTQKNIENFDKEANINGNLFAKVDSDVEKGKAIKNQLLIWDFLLDYRLKFQKCLNASNRFPSFENFSKFSNLGGNEFEEELQKCQKSLKHLLSSLITLQESLLKSNKDYISSLNSNNSVENKTFNNNAKNKSKELEDKTITFKATQVKPKVKHLSDFSNNISKNHQDFERYRNNVIQKWNDKTRLGCVSNKNFSAFEQSTLKQIQHILLDKQRLIFRTQTKRSNYHILGCNDDEEPPLKKQANLETTDTENLGSKNKPVLIKEIFDDDDFYHQLLSELVRRKANDITDPVQLGRQWMQLQKIRSKIKKTVDTKASKGRKVRYVVHPKLVNFMMPNSEQWYNENSRTDFLNSLFGKKLNDFTVLK